MTKPKPPLSIWIVLNPHGVPLDGIRTSRGEAQFYATVSEGVPWVSLAKEGFRVVKYKYEKEPQ